MTKGRSRNADLGKFSLPIPACAILGVLSTFLHGFSHLMSLKELSLPSVIDSSTADMAREFVVPALSASLRYDRGVGFFSSGWLRVVAQGLVAFAANGGRARLITSPILAASDWEALLQFVKGKYND
ncbi:MAG: hypothetical protein OT477_00160 [Chloroflexi bacterium]|nr:hypothetical protein [Chloroflexota bacterium]